MNGIILAGGKSSRIGVDKAFVEFKGVPIIERILSVLGTLFDERLIVANHPEKYSYLKCRIVPDQHKNIGPLGGLHAGLCASGSHLNFATACDMPLINREVVKYLISFTGYDAVAPVIGGFFEPLLAVYSKNCLPVLEEMIKQKSYKINLLYDKVKTKYVAEKDLRVLDPELLSFSNINTLQELKNISK